MRAVLFSSLLAVLVLTTQGRPVRVWSYQELYTSSDLVVIAKAVSTKDTREQASLPGIQPDVKVIGVITGLEVQVVFKGEKTRTKVYLHHYRLADPAMPMTNGPSLVAFDSKKNESYLFFLKQETPDGPYAPVSGQTDPAWISVIRLEAVVR